jgi:RimJ/RimL family protein N-acetyltransferase
MSAHVLLRPTTPADLPALFAQQRDPLSNEMAGTKPHSEEAFFKVWEGIFKNPQVVPRVIVEGERIVGAINCFQREGLDMIGYWIDKPHWGRGIATRALTLFLGELKRRPLHATAARSNAASIRILERCGFRLTGYHMGEETDRYVAREVATFVLE